MNPVLSTWALIGKRKVIDFIKSPRIKIGFDTGIKTLKGVSYGRSHELSAKERGPQGRP